MKKITNISVINMINVLNLFADKKLPQRISYAITKNMVILQKEYECYIKSLHKLTQQYDEFIVRGEDDQVVYNDIGIPILSNEEKSVEFNEEIKNLLNIEIEVNLYYIPDSVFDYTDNTNRYDSLSASDILNLQSILCTQEGSDINEVSD